MGRRCPRSKALGLARLERHRLAVMREGWLTAVRAPSSTVHGVLWDLALSDIPALDRHESLSQGLYVKLTQAVIAERGPKQAIVYFGVNAGPGAARPAYLAEVLAAARSWPLPGEAVAALERMCGSRPTAAQRRLLALGALQSVSVIFLPDRRSPLENFADRRLL